MLETPGLDQLRRQLQRKKAGLESIFQVKQNHVLYPEKAIQDALQVAPGGTKIVLSGQRSSGVKVIAIGYKYNKRTVLNFVTTLESGSTTDETPYEMKWADSKGNVHVQMIPRPAVISKFFDNCNEGDLHNHMRQFCLKLEKKWVTSNCYFQLSTTLIGINVVNTFQLAQCNGILPLGSLNLNPQETNYNNNNEFTMKQFAGIVSTQLLYKANNLGTPKNTTDEDDMKDPTHLTTPNSKKRKATNTSEEGSSIKTHKHSDSCTSSEKKRKVRESTNYANTQPRPKNQCKHQDISSVSMQVRVTATMI